MSKLIPTYIEQALRIEVLERAVIASEGDVEHLERELAEAQAEVVRLKGEAESWEQVFDRTCELLAEAKTALAETTVKDSLKTVKRLDFDHLDMLVSERIGALKLLAQGVQESAVHDAICRDLILPCVYTLAQFIESVKIEDKESK